LFAFEVKGELLAPLESFIRKVKIESCTGGTEEQIRRGLSDPAAVEALSADSHGVAA
jgi:hypothetical protein